jgi:hypothetical protein
VHYNTRKTALFAGLQAARRALVVATATSISRGSVTICSAMCFMPHLLRGEQNDETLAAALRTPHQTTPPLLFSVKVEETLDDFIRSGELLIRSNLLYRHAPLDLKDDEVAKDALVNRSANTYPR